MAWFALAGMLASAPLWAQTGQEAPVARAVRKNAAAVVRQQAEVKRLQGDLAAQESERKAAAEKLRQQDARIAELQRQLQAASQAGTAAGQGH